MSIPLILNTVFIYTVALLAVVLVGSRLDSVFRLTHRRTQLLMSLISGVLLGIAVFHLLPHAVYASSLGVDHVVKYLMLGLLLMFFLQRLFHFHHHEYDAEAHSLDAASHAAHCEHAQQETSKTGQAGLGVLLGLSIHSVIDGFVLAVSMQSDWHLGAGGLAGFSVFVAILLHKPLDALTLRFFMRDKNIPATQQNIVLCAYALICPIVLATLFMLSQNTFEVSPSFIAAALGFSSGVFLCVALSDLLPEIHFHDHDRVKMTLALLLGVALSLLLSNIEPEHRHQPQFDRSTPSEHVPHEKTHGQHDHG